LRVERNQKAFDGLFVCPHKARILLKKFKVCLEVKTLDVEGVGKSVGHLLGKKLVKHNVELRRGNVCARLFSQKFAVGFVVCKIFFRKLFERFSDERVVFIQSLKLSDNVCHNYFVLKKFLYGEILRKKKKFVKRKIGFEKRYMMIIFFFKGDMMIVFDKMQQGYSYEYAAPQGKNFAKDFKPELTPKEMLDMGVFEGHYMTDCQNEFPLSWFENARISPNKPCINCNFFELKSRMSLKEWQKRGWILEPDPRGWFQWYCRYYMGRRVEAIDALQIKRWKAFKRHKAQVFLNCALYDFDCRRKQRQALLQWAYNPLF